MNGMSFTTGYNYEFTLCVDRKWGNRPGEGSPSLFLWSLVSQEKALYPRKFVSQEMRECPPEEELSEPSLSPSLFLAILVNLKDHLVMSSQPNSEVGNAWAGWTSFLRGGFPI